MLKAYKYRLYPNKEQEEMFAKHFGCVRYIYNYGLQKKIKVYQETKKSVSCFELTKEVTQMKYDKPWLKEVNSQSLQMALRNLDNGFTAFFRKNNSFPKFKNKDSRQSFQCPQYVKLDWENQYLSLPKISPVKIKLHRVFQGEIRTCTISRTCTGKYHISILVEDGRELPKKKPVVSAVGIDVGIKTFATLSTGEKIDNPKHLKSGLQRLKVVQRRLSRKQKGSNNKRKFKQMVSVLHEKITNKRLDFLHKLSSKLISDNQAIALEDLCVKGMVRNHKLAQSISDCSWSKFMDLLEYKADWNGCTVKKIGRFQPSSKICSCGAINHNLKLSDRTWTCSICELTHDRDVLASHNILKFSGLGQSARACGVADISQGVEAGSHVL